MLLRLLFLAALLLTVPLSAQTTPLADPALETETATAPFTYNLTAADYFVIGAYLLLLASIGFILKRLCQGSRDYLIGGNKIPWWLAGASIFMMSFSAWTFTGAAGFAYEYGIRIILIYSTLSGSWAVMTTDFLQSIILMTLSVVIAALTLVEAGGPGPLFRPDASDRELFIASRVFNFLTALVVIAVGLGLRRLGAPRRNETHLGS